MTTLKHLRMTAFYGFALIELLVVVLIIGILAAIALPQYRVAVAKSRFAQLQILGDAIYQAEQIYYMANGAYTKDFSELSPLPPGTISESGASISAPGKAGCSLLLGKNESGANFAEFNCVTLPGGWSDTNTPVYIRGFKSPYGSCRALNTDLNSVANKVCKSLSGATASCNVSDGYCQYPLKSF